MEDDKLCEAERGAEAFRKQHFQTGEMKSSGLGTKIDRRLKVIRDLLSLPISICAYAVNKTDVVRNSPLQYKKTFHKYLHRRVYSRIARFHSDVSISSDEHGTKDFMDGFKKFITEKDFGIMFPQAQFHFLNSKNSVLIQVADIFAGTIGKVFHAETLKGDRDIILNELKDKLIEFDVWPRVYERNSSRRIEATINSGDDGKVREFCLRAVDSYLSGLLEMEEDSLVRETVLEYLATEAISENDGYVTAARLVSFLKDSGFKEINEQFLRTKVISHYRDSGIIIASSSNGYKIPTSVSDVYDYVQHCASIICPMKERLNRARTSVRQVTHNRIDILAGGALDFLKADIFDSMKNGAMPE